MATAFITGASRGIGKATATLFAKNGWDLILTARNEESLKLLADELSKENVKVSYIAMDLSDSNQISIQLPTFLKENNSPSVLINNAGVAWTGELMSMPIRTWEWLIQVNLTSIFQICTNVIPLMRSNGGGLVINVSSHAARNAFSGWSAYCVSKAALENFTKCLAEEERANSIRACTLTIGSVNSSLWDTDTVQGSFDRDAMLDRSEVAKALLHLANQPPTQIIEDMTLMPATGAF